MLVFYRKKRICSLSNSHCSGKTKKIGDLCQLQLYGTSYLFVSFAPTGQISQEGSGHPFAIHNDACLRRFPPSLFIASHHLGQSHGQMLVSTRGCCQARMSLLIMQKGQRTPSQDFAGAPDESTWDQAVGIDGLAVPIDVQTGSRFLLEALFPQVGRPRTKGRGQRFGPLSFSELAQKPLGVAIPIGPMSCSHHCQRVSGVSSQVMRSMQTAQGQEQQRQHQLAKATRGTGEQRSRGCWLTRGDRRFQIAEQTGLLSGCQE